MHSLTFKYVPSCLILDAEFCSNKFWGDLSSDVIVKMLTRHLIYSFLNYSISEMKLTQKETFNTIWVVTFLNTFLKLFNTFSYEDMKKKLQLCRQHFPWRHSIHQPLKYSAAKGTCNLDLQPPSDIAQGPNDMPVQPNRYTCKFPPTLVRNRKLSRSARRSFWSMILGKK